MQVMTTATTYYMLPVHGLFGQSTKGAGPSRYRLSCSTTAASPNQQHLAACFPLPTRLLPSPAAWSEHTSRTHMLSLATLAGSFHPP